MTLKEAIQNNIGAYVNWNKNGRHEADNELNDSNRELIRAYQKEYPNAKGYKLNDGIVDLDGELYNFCCDYIFDGSKKIVDALNKESEEYKKFDILEKFDAICLVWS